MMDMDDIDFTALDNGGEEIMRRVHDVTEMGAVVPMTEEPRAKPFSRGVTRKGVWHVRCDQIKELPQLYSLESTAVFVPNEDPSVISERISAELRDRSIEAYYDDDFAKAKCCTADGTDFCVRMYRGRENFSHGIIVEVQRTFGMSMNFHTDAMAILDRAQGKEIPRSLKRSSLPLVSDCGEEDVYPTDGSSSLAMVAKMIKSSCYDSQCLGLQILSSLTDASKVGTATARIISNEVLRPENEVGAMVLSLIWGFTQGDNSSKFRNMMLTIVANAIVSLQGKIPNMLREQLVAVLTKDLLLSETNQHCAFQAARCLEWLLSPGEDDQSITQCYETALVTAVELGNARHAALEKQARKCLDKIFRIRQ